MIQRPEKTAKNLANRRITIQCASEEEARLIKGISEDWARIKGKITSRLNEEVLLAAYLPEHAEAAARSMYSGQPILDALSALAEQYAASAGLHPRDDRGAEFLGWALGYCTRSQAQFHQNGPEKNYVVGRIERLIELLPDASAVRVDATETALYLQNDYGLYWAGNFPRLLLDGWQHWGGHSFCYRIMAAVLRDSQTEEHYIDSPTDRLGLLELVSRLHADINRRTREERETELDFSVTRLTLDGGGGHA